VPLLVPFVLKVFWLFLTQTLEEAGFRQYLVLKIGTADAVWPATRLYI
jgi:hypothetical protein